MQPTLDDIAEVIDAFTPEDLDKLALLIEETRQKNLLAERKARKKEIIEMLKANPLFRHDKRDSVEIVEEIRSNMFHPSRDEE